MADPNEPDAETSPAAADGETGLQGGYGGDTGFASDQAQGASGQTQDGEFRGEGESATSGSETEAGDGQGGSASGAEPPTRFDAVPAGAGAAGLDADVTESAGGVLGAGAQSGGQTSQPGAGAKRLATEDVEDAGHFDHGEEHGGRGDPIGNTGHPNAQQQKSAF